MDEIKIEIDSEIKVAEKETYFNRETLEMLTDSLEIIYYKNLQFEEIINNNLLGEFKKNGNYEIDKEILLELISAKKIIKESKDNKYILSVPIKEGFESFVLTLQIEDELDKQIAILKIVETNLKSNGEKELLKTQIGKYKDDRDIYFLIKVKKLFNIVDSENGGKDLDNEEFLKLILKKIQNFKSFKNKSGNLEEIAKDYINKIIEIMKDNPGKYSDYILRHYGIYLLEMQDLTGDSKYYQKMKYKLDNLLNETRKKIKDPVLDPLIEAARKEFLKQFEIIKEEILNPKPVITKPKIKENAQTKRQTQEEKKSGGGKKSSAKKIAVAKKVSAKKTAVKNYPTFKPQENFIKELKPKEKIEKVEKQPKEDLNQDKDSSNLLLRALLYQESIISPANTAQSQNNKMEMSL